MFILFLVILGENENKIRKSIHKPLILKKLINFKTNATLHNYFSHKFSHHLLSSKHSEKQNLNFVPGQFILCAFLPPGASQNTE